MTILAWHFTARSAQNAMLTRWVEHVHAHGSLPREIRAWELAEPARSLVQRA